MININLLDVSQGWRWSTIPDNIEFEIIIDDGIVKTMASLRDIVKIYSNIVEGNSCTLRIGTGAKVRVHQDQLCINDIKIEGQKSDLEEEFRELIKRICVEKDKKDPENRDTEIYHIDDHINKVYGFNTNYMEMVYTSDDSYDNL